MRPSQFHHFDDADFNDSWISVAPCVALTFLDFEADLNDSWRGPSDVCYSAHFATGDTVRPSQLCRFRQYLVLSCIMCGFDVLDFEADLNDSWTLLQMCGSVLLRDRCAILCALHLHGCRVPYTSAQFQGFHSHSRTSDFLVLTCFALLHNLMVSILIQVPWSSLNRMVVKCIAPLACLVVKVPCTFEQPRGNQSHLSALVTCAAEPGPTHPSLAFCLRDRYRTAQV